MFNNTEIAFQGKSNNDLKRAYWLFRIISSKNAVRIGNFFLVISLKLRLPIKWLIKATVFKQFCGGESINKCDKTIETLTKFNIGTILDYSVEGKSDGSSSENAVNEIKKTITRASKDKAIPFAVFKASGLGSLELLEKANQGDSLKQQEKINLQEFYNRIHDICEFAFHNDVCIFIDAEETWIQDKIDDWTLELIKKFNKEKAIVFNTLQMYRTDRLEYLYKMHQFARNNEVIYGIKLVRGAYMEKERERALLLNHPSPIHKNKQDTDDDFNTAIKYIFENNKSFSLCVGSHNENSNQILVDLMEKEKIKASDSSFYFSQLLGMSDHISYNLAHLGYNVSKYVPYGPINKVMPYLLRRVEENTSVSGQTGRELALITEEKKRRRELKQA